MTSTPKVLPNESVRPGYGRQILTHTCGKARDESLRNPTRPPRVCGGISEKVAEQRILLGRSAVVVASRALHLSKGKLRVVGGAVAQTRRGSVELFVRHFEGGTSDLSDPKHCNFGLGRFGPSKCKSDEDFRILGQLGRFISHDSCPAQEVASQFVYALENDLEGPCLS